MKGWQTLDSSNNKFLSFIGMYFGDELQKEKDVSVGLISAAVGGTRIERWSEDLTGDLYNNHIYPFRNYKLNGILWYQGCSDADTSDILRMPFVMPVGYLSLSG